ncbi:MAG: HYR domain-containing protein, partial [Bacteroidota bacterium]
IPYWNFTANAGETYHFSLGSSSEDTYLHLYNAGYAEIASNDDAGPFNPGGASSLSWTCATGGTYYITACHYTCDPFSSSSYLKYWSTSGEYGTGSGGTLSPTNTWQNETYTSGNLYWYYFDASTDYTYDFSLCSNVEDSYLYIYNTNWDEQTSNDDDGIFCSGVSASLTWTPSTSGTYIVAINGYGCVPFGNSSDLAYKFSCLSDITPPTITAPADVNSVADIGSCDASGVTLGTPVTADDCSVASVTNNAPATFSLGITTVTWTVTDGFGNTATSDQTVTITDDQDPTITAPADLNAVADIGSCDATGVVLGTPVTADNCSVASETNDAPASFPLGITTVTWTVTDGSGNTSTTTQMVTVTEDQDPTITAPADVNAVADIGSCDATGIVLGTPVTADNCSVASETNDAPAAFPLGITTVTWTVTDGSGNTATATQTVTITDDQDPTITAPADLNTVADIGSCDATGVVLGTPVTADNCSVASETNDAPATFPLGITTVTWTVTDGSGNTATATQIVTVTEDQDPIVQTQDITVYLDASGTVTILPSDVDNGSSDNCSSVTLSIDINTFDCSNIGNNTVTLVATDLSGNTGTSTAVVNVLDNISPEIICISDTVIEVLSPSNSYTVIDNSFDATASDNCSFSLVNDFNTSATLLGDEIPEGITYVEWTATDLSGNVVTCTVMITVDVVSSISQTVNENISIYPNPARSIVNIVIPEGDYNLSLMDITGKVLYNSKLINKNNSIDVSEYAKGIYLMEVKSGTSSKVFRLVIE